MPTYTSTRPITPRQQRFIASLANERTVPEYETRFVLAAAGGTLSSADASTLIGRLSDCPRRTAQSGTGTPVPAPSTSTRAGRMLDAGGIEATVTLTDGRHVTVSIRTRGRVGRGYSNMNPTDEGARTNISILGARVGWVSVDADGWHLHLRTRRPEYRVAVEAVFAHAAGESVSPLRVQEASRCGRCFRTLTDPVSIDRGIGPECLGRVTGSRHVHRDHSLAPTTEVSAREALETLADALSAPAPTHRRSSREVAAELRLDRDQKRARDMIAEALDSYFEAADRDFAMAAFDRLAAR